MMDKKNWRFKIELMPAPTYVYGNALEPLPPLPRCKPAFTEDGTDLTRLPAWIDINSDEVTQIWELCLNMVLSVLIARPGLTAGKLVSYVAPSLEEWEIKMVMRWLVDAKAAARMGLLPGSGVRLKEWWWMCMLG